MRRSERKSAKTAQRRGRGHQTTASKMGWECRSQREMCRCATDGLFRHGIVTTLGFLEAPVDQRLSNMGGPLQLYLSLNISTPRFVPSCGGLRVKSVLAQIAWWRASCQYPLFRHASIRLTAGRPPLEDVAFAVSQPLPRLHTSTGQLGVARAVCVSMCWKAAFASFQHAKRASRRLRSGRVSFWQPWWPTLVVRKMRCAVGFMKRPSPRRAILTKPPYLASMVQLLSAA